MLVTLPYHSNLKHLKWERKAEQWTHGLKIFFILFTILIGCIFDIFYQLLRPAGNSIPSGKANLVYNGLNVMCKHLFRFERS